MTARPSRSDRLRTCNLVDRQITTEVRRRLHALECSRQSLSPSWRMTIAFGMSRHTRVLGLFVTELGDEPAAYRGGAALTLAGYDSESAENTSFILSKLVRVFLFPCLGVTTDSALVSPVSIYDFR